MDIRSRLIWIVGLDITFPKRPLSKNNIHNRMWDFTPWSKRNSEPEPRIHEELTETSRVRLANIICQNTKQDYIRKADNLLRDYTGKEIDSLSYNTRQATVTSLDKFIRTSEDMDLFLDFLEYLLNVMWSNRDFRRQNDVILMAHKIEKTLVEEGILVQMKPSVEEIADWDVPNPQVNEYIKFQQVADETIIEADQETRVLALGEPWKEPLKPYNEAWDLYKNDVLDSSLTEKLAKSIQQVTEEICKEQEDWVDQGAGLGTCLNEMKDRGLFDPNKSMVAEWQKIVDGLQIGVQKPAGDKHRHEPIDQDYAILLLHQTSAFLTFVIKRYESKYC